MSPSVLEVHAMKYRYIIRKSREETDPTPLVRRFARAAAVGRRRVEALGQQPPQLAGAEPRVDRLLACCEVAMLFHKRQQQVQLFRAYSTSCQNATHRSQT